MSGRPEILFPLFAGLTTLDGVGPKNAQHLHQMAVEKPRDLLFTLPYAGIDRRRRDSVLDAELPAVVTVEVEIIAHRPARGRGGAYRITVRDSRSTFQLVFFHARADYLNRSLPVGARRLVSGRVELFDGGRRWSTPTMSPGSKRLPRSRLSNRSIR